MIKNDYNNHKHKLNIKILIVPSSSHFVVQSHSDYYNNKVYCERNSKMTENWNVLFLMSHNSLPFIIESNGKVRVLFLCPFWLNNLRSQTRFGSSLWRRRRRRKRSGWLWNDHRIGFVANNPNNSNRFFSKLFDKSQFVACQRHLFLPNVSIFFLIAKVNGSKRRLCSKQPNWIKLLCQA